MRTAFAVLSSMLFCYLVAGETLPEIRPRPNRPRPTIVQPGPRPGPPTKPDESIRNALKERSRQKALSRRGEQQAAISTAAVRQIGSRSPEVIVQRSSVQANIFQLPSSLIITPTSVTYNGITYPVTNGIVTIQGSQYVVCPGAIGLLGQYICCGTMLVQSNNGARECCGDTYYTPLTEVCCAPNVFDRTFLGFEIGCCADQPLFVGFEICCNGVIEDGLACPGPGDCPFGFACCNGYRVRSETGLRCCNNMFYQSAIQKCCEDTQVRLLIESCDSCVPSSNQFCCNNVAFPSGQGIECCNDAQVFTPDYLQCCNNMVIPNTSPCNGNCVPTSSFFCCGSESIPRNVGVGCCNGETFSTSGAECCGGVTVISTVTQCCVGGAPSTSCP